VAQALAELAQALARPLQRGLRIAAGIGLDQRAQILHQAGIRRAERLAPIAWPAHAAFRHIFPAQSGKTRRLHHRADSAVPSRYRLSRTKTATAALVQLRREHLETLPNRPFINHPTLISYCESTGNPANQKNTSQASPYSRTVPKSVCLIV